MSDCDSEDYSSSDDEDYVPSGGEYSEDDVHELEKEDDDDEQEDGEDKKPSKSKTKKKTKSITARKRKKGVLVLNTEGGVEKHEDKAQNLEEANDLDLNEEKKQKLEEAKKKHEDDLWSSFLFDVGPKPKPQMAATTTESAQIQPQKPKESAKPALKSLETKEESKKVTITKVFDFAGEEVRITKEVDSTSKEAREFVKQQEKGEPETSPLPSRTNAPAGSGGKRTGGTGGLGSILGKLGGKKQKLSTLEKSKMDWNSFKEKEGISEELAIHNRGKDGYIERKAFLERVDYRQFELEREIRLKNMKPA